ncbi:response regulator [Paenibacillus psychroresistens]|uniref:Response regulator n=1 Tax=Paenibacillus psychroresistens TaxID=1778678 RepID=A0A6B8RJA1_9BACL|nr:response regulator [Paenibacillus psychroresistens]QGQ96340.1 response regulator [Paenibacillus psychroresistens]
MKRIMIVDDSTVMRKNLRSILTQAGYEVIAEAVNGEEAYQTYVRLLPDLVTMDVTMPIMNGLEAVKKIRADYADACIIVISAFDQRSMLFEALEHGAKHYIIKPITADKLLNVVEKVLAAESTSEPMPSANPDQPVSISNRNGMFVVAIPQKLSAEGLQPIKSALQGLLFIKPLHIAFDFNEAPFLEQSILAELTEIIKTIRQAEGVVQLIARSQELQVSLTQHFSGITITYE